MSSTILWLCPAFYLPLEGKKSRRGAVKVCGESEFW